MAVQLTAVLENEQVKNVWNKTIFIDNWIKLTFTVYILALFRQLSNHFHPNS